MLRLAAGALEDTISDRRFHAWSVSWKTETFWHMLANRRVVHRVREVVGL